MAPATCPFWSKKGELQNLGRSNYLRAICEPRAFAEACADRLPTQREAHTPPRCQWRAGSLRPSARAAGYTSTASRIHKHGVEPTCALALAALRRQGEGGAAAKAVAPLQRTKAPPHEVKRSHAQLHCQPDVCCLAALPQVRRGTGDGERGQHGWVDEEAEQGCCVRGKTFKRSKSPIV